MALKTHKRRHGVQAQDLIKKKDVVFFYRKDGSFFRDLKVKSKDTSKILVEIPSVMGDTEIIGGILYFIEKSYGYTILHYMESQ